MDVYRIGVSVLATNGVTPVLNTIGRGFTGLQGQAAGIGSAIGGWGILLGGVAAVLATGAIAKGLYEIGKAGGEVNHQLELMKTAGMSVVEVQSSVAQAMKTSNEVMTTTLVENLKHIRELRYAFGETTTAIEHLDEISKANAILNNVRGGKGKDEVWELVKSLEMKGITYDPKEFSQYVDAMTRVTQATGGRVSPQMFMSTFKYGRTSMLGWDEKFIEGALPRLIQSMATGGGGGGAGTGGPGNALMSAFAKVVQGQMSKTAAEEFERMGLGNAKAIKGSSESQIKGGIKGRDLFIANPYEWVQQILMPALAAKGITSQNDIISQISKMFPVRTASQIITEMGLQGRFHEGQKSPFEKDIALQKLPSGLPAYEELAKHDYPMIMEQFNKQWENFLQTLGGPMMASNGPVISALAGLVTVLGSLAKAAAPLGQAIATSIAFGETLLSIGVKLADFFAKVTNIGAVFELFGRIPWVTIQSGLDSVRNALARLSEWLLSVTSMVEKIDGLFSNKKLDKETQDFRDALRQNQSFQFDPSKEKVKATPISMSLNVDGRTLAQTIAEQLGFLYEHPTGAPSYDGMRRFAPADSGLMGT